MEQRRNGQKRNRTDLRSLLRNRAVQGTLAATFGLQAIATASKKPQDVEALTLEPVQVVQPDPRVLKDPDHPLAIAFREKEVAVKTDALRDRYTKEGFSISPDLAKEIGEAAMEHDIDPELAFGLVRVESGFKNSATSVVGAVGLTQLMPGTARWMEPGVTRRELRNPEKNLRIGFKYLRYLIDKYEGNEDLALLAYNRGPGTVDKALKRGRNPDNGYAAFVRGEKNHGHKLFTR